MQLSGDQLVLIGGISTILVEFIKFVLGLKKVKVSRTVLAILVAVMSLGLGYLWLAPAVAVAFVSGDPMTILGALLNMAVAIVGYATLIYNIILANLIKGVKDFISDLDSGIKSGA